MNAILVVVFSIICSSVAQLLLKKGVNSLGNLDFSADLLRAYLAIYRTPLVLIGTGLYAFAALMWLYAISKVNLSLAYPLAALGYVVTVIGAGAFLGETVSLTRWIGIAVLCVGVCIIGLGE